jgi:hypothetical protein
MINIALAAQVSGLPVNGEQAGISQAEFVNRC